MTRYLKMTSILLCALFLGCSSNPDRSQVRLSMNGNVQMLKNTLEVQLITPTWWRTLHGPDFSITIPPDATPYFETPTFGTLQAIIQLHDSTGAVRSSGAIALDIRPDWSWDIWIVLNDRNPFSTCFGCIGSRTIEVNAAFQRSAGDSLFVVWGGNSIKHPAIY